MTFVLWKSDSCNLQHHLVFYFETLNPSGPYLMKNRGGKFGGLSHYQLSDCVCYGRTAPVQQSLPTVP